MVQRNFTGQGRLAQEANMEDLISYVLFFAAWGGFMALCYLVLSAFEVISWWIFGI